MSFQVGQKVVAIYTFRNPFQTHDYPNGMPVEGQVYVVSDFHDYGLFQALLLIGLPCIRDGEDRGYLASKFRLLDELKAEAAKRQRKETPTCA